MAITESDIKSKGNKSKNKQVGLHKIWKFLHSKGHHQQKGKSNYWMRENICKSKIYKELTQLSKITIQLKIRQNIWIDILLKMIFRWSTRTWKYAQHHQSLGKCKSKPQWHVSSHLLGWLFIKKTRGGKGKRKQMLMRMWRTRNPCALLGM